jgi:hypothetical protein
MPSIETLTSKPSGYNQAFFKKLYVLAERDDQAETTAWLSGVELTEPYALLLTEGLFEQAEAETQALATQNRAGNAADERSAGPVSIYEQMAEGGGFEPPRPVARPNGFQDRRIQPLCHPSRGAHPRGASQDATRWPIGTTDGRDRGAIDGRDRGTTDDSDRPRTSGYAYPSYDVSG